MAFGDGTKPYANIRVDAASTNITTGAWLEILTAANNVDNCSEIEIHNATTQDLRIGYGASGSEQDWFYIPGAGTGYLGGNGKIKAQLSAGLRLALRSLGSNATTGTVVINLWSR